MSTTLDNSSVWQTKLLWIAVAVLGAVAFAIVALNRGEAVNAAWLVNTAVCIYFIAFRACAKVRHRPLTPRRDC
jgi:carbon starvation protein